jgi:hypothetical protein
MRSRRRADARMTEQSRRGRDAGRHPKSSLMEDGSRDVAV